MSTTTQRVSGNMVGCSASDEKAINSYLINVIGLIGIRCHTIVEVGTRLTAEKIDFQNPGTNWILI